MNDIKFNELLLLINKIPRVHLANLPTPLEKAESLSKLLAGPSIYFKRDDLTGLPLSGNKTRMFEFSFAKAIEDKAEIILAGAGVQSNYCRQVAFACNKFGLESFLVLCNLRGNKDYQIQGNLFLDLLAGAQVKIINADIFELKSILESVKNDLERKTGKKVHIMRYTDYDVAIEGLAFTNCGLEIYKQLSDMNIKIDYIYLCSSDTTQAGLVVANKFLNAGWKIIGISPIGSNIDIKARVKKISEDIVKILGFKLEIKEEDVINFSDYVGDRYGIMSPESRKAIEVVARTESIVLDPVYSGKGMAGFLDHVNKGKFLKSESVLFLNTGGFPSIFAFADEFDFSSSISFN